MVRSFRFRVKPTKKQERLLATWLEVTRELYNAALQERRDAWAKQRRKTHVLDQFRQLPALKILRPDVGEIPNVVLRGTLQQIDSAFRDFYGRCRRGERPGYPRFKGTSHWRTISIDDLERARAGKLFVSEGRRVWIPVLGKLKINMHRPIEGTPKTLRIVRARDGRWTVRIACVDIPPRTLERTGRDVGIDPGINSFVATSDGVLFPNPRPGRLHENILARAARRVHRRKLGSIRRRKAVRLLAKKSAYVAAVRRQNCIDVANALVAQYDTIYVENLTVKRLCEGQLAKSFRDSALGSFFNWLREKAENAGRVIVEVPPAYTSQTCPRCGVRAPKERNERRHHCVACGLEEDRDIAAAQVILKLGRSSQGAAAVVDAQRRSAKVKSVDATGA